MLERLVVLIHVSAATLVVMSLGTMCWHVHRGGTRQFPERKFLMLTHGISLMVVLAAGMGLKSLHAVEAWPVWLILKAVLWLGLGGIAGFIFRLPKKSIPLWWTAWVLGTMAMGLGLIH